MVTKTFFGNLHLFSRVRSSAQLDYSLVGVKITQINISSGYCQLEGTDSLSAPHTTFSEE